MPFWQPANILHSVLIFMLLWQINIVVVVLYIDDDDVAAAVLCMKAFTILIMVCRLGQRIGCVCVTAERPAAAVQGMVWYSRETTQCRVVLQAK